MPSSSAVICLVLGLATLYAVVRRSRNANRAPLPPGPKGLPLLGNLNDLPKPGELEAHHWLKHKDLYGSYDLFSKVSQTLYGQSFAKPSATGQGQAPLAL
jgi:hypothetical protein